MSSRVLSCAVRLDWHAHRRGRTGRPDKERTPAARPAGLLADAIGTVVGAGLGTSTVTAYVESATGVAAGGRTGLTSVVTSALFLLALFFFLW